MPNKVKRLYKTVSRRLNDDYYLRYYKNAKLDNSAVLIEPKEGAEFASNMLYLAKEISKEEFGAYTLYVVYAQGKKSLFEAMMERYGIRAILVERMSTMYLRLLASAKYLFTDSTFPHFFIKKQGQVYTNTWHGTPLKNMGKHEAKRAFAVGNLIRNFVMADYLVYPCREMREKMCAAFNLKGLATGSILNAGYPRNSVFFDKERAAEVRSELELQQKRVIVYMPTWRGTLTNRDTVNQQRAILDMFESIDLMLDDDTVILAKMHPLSRIEIDASAFMHIRAFPEGYETYDVLNAADALVTDYSSVMFDFANTGKPIIIFAYDLDDYEIERGMYYRLDEFPFPIVRTVEGLAAQIYADSVPVYREFQESFCTYDRPDASKLIVSYVLQNEGLTEDEVDRASLQRNSTLNVLHPVSDISEALQISERYGWERGECQEAQRNVLTFIPNKAIAHDSEMIAGLPEDVVLFPVAEGGFRYTLPEWFASRLHSHLGLRGKWVSNVLNRHYEREALRVFGGAHFDEVVVQRHISEKLRALLHGLDIPDWRNELDES